MTSLLLLWTRIFGDAAPRRSTAQGRPLPDVGSELATAGILLVLRRMRAPLITLIVIFAVSVLGLSLVPGADANGSSHRLDLFEAFYFMSYTATTIGFGEIPYAFTPAQRMWVIFAIFLSVVGWAYAIGSLLSLLQDRAFRRALARRRFAREVRRIGEPFLLLVGYGHTTQMLARSLDDMGRRFVVLDDDEDRVSSVDLDGHRAEVPALHGNARDTGEMVLAGLGHPHCEGVVALTGDDETNLDVTMTSALIRPELPVIARTNSAEVGERMRAFHPQQVVNPLDRFGDHLRILLRSPAAYQLMMWLTSAPGTPLPPRREPLPRGRWIVCGDGPFGRELSGDLRAEGIEVAVAGADPRAPGNAWSDPLDPARLGSAVAFVAATESDTTNLWLVEQVRRTRPDTYVVAMQNHVANSALYEAVGVDLRVVPAEVIGHEILARLASPVLMRFLPEVPHQGDEWARQTVGRLVQHSGRRTPHLWGIALTAEDAPAVHAWVDAGEVTVGDLLRSPRDRDQGLDAVALTLLRDGTRSLTPADQEPLRSGDRLLLAGRLSARRLLDLTLLDPPTATYVLEGRTVPVGWVWQRFSGQRAGRDPGRTTSPTSGG